MIVRDINVRLDGKPILKGISTKVEESSLIGIIGPNGAGKTTFLRTINGSLEPETGDVYIEGENIHDISSKRASKLIATVPQELYVSFDFTVRDIIQMGRNPHIPKLGGLREKDRQMVKKAMQITETSEFADRSISKVSGGEKQRILIARAIAQETPVLLLDEPTTNLDINYKINILDLASSLIDQGKKIVIAIHNLNLAARYCDKLLMISNGKKIGEGNPKEVLTEKNIEKIFGIDVKVRIDPLTDSVKITALSGQYSEIY